MKQVDHEAVIPFEIEAMDGKELRECMVELATEKGRDRKDAAELAEMICTELDRYHYLCEKSLDDPEAQTEEVFAALDRLSENDRKNALSQLSYGLFLSTDSRRFRWFNSIAPEMQAEYQENWASMDEAILRNKLKEFLGGLSDRQDFLNNALDRVFGPDRFFGKKEQTELFKNALAFGRSSYELKALLVMDHCLELEEEREQQPEEGEEPEEYSREEMVAEAVGNVSAVVDLASLEDQVEKGLMKREKACKLAKIILSVAAVLVVIVLVATLIPKLAVVMNPTTVTVLKQTPKVFVPVAGPTMPVGVTVLKKTMRVGRAAAIGGGGLLAGTWLLRKIPKLVDKLRIRYPKLARLTRGETTLVGKVKAFFKNLFDPKKNTAEEKKLRVDDDLHRNFDDEDEEDDRVPDYT